jgi:putative transposase
MNTYKHHRFPPDIISYAVWFYHRFNLSHRDIDEVFVKINGKQHYQWRAVDQDGEVVAQSWRRSQKDRDG